MKITEKVSFNIASEASYVYTSSGQKLIKNAKNGPFWRVFWKTWSLRSNSVTRQVSFKKTKIGENCQNSNATFLVIFKQCECVKKVSFFGMKITIFQKSKNFDNQLIFFQIVLTFCFDSQLIFAKFCSHFLISWFVYQIELTFVLIISWFLPNWAHICFDNQLIFAKFCSHLFWY